MSENDGQEVTLYALSTCGWCKMTKGWLDDNNVKYDCIYVDHLSKEEREKLISELTDRLGRRPAFPTVFRGDRFVVGFNKEQLTELLGP
jgi:glutaredoxin-like protein NrdH